MNERKPLHSTMRVSTHHCNLKSIIIAIMVNTSIVGLYVFKRDLAEPRTMGMLKPKPHNTLTGLSCALEEALIKVKTTKMWDSRVVQETNNGEIHCIELIFFDNASGSFPESNFGGSEIIINLSGAFLLSEYPLAQPGFFRRGEFRYGFDIVTSPFIPTPLKMDYLAEQYDVIHKKRDIKVCSLSEYQETLKELVGDTALEYKEQNSLQEAYFVVLLESESLVHNLELALRLGAIPILALEQGANPNAYLPFSEVLEWSKAMVMTTTKGLKDVLGDFIPSIQFHEIIHMQRQGHKYWQAYMSSKERVLDTTMAVVRQRLGIEPPYFKDVRTLDATQPGESYFMPTPNHKWQQSSNKEVNFRWNNIFYPWEKTPFSFHFDIGRKEMPFFPWVSKRQHDPEKFTVVMMSYKRQESVRELLAGLNGLDKMDRAILIWNDIGSQVPESITSTLPKEKLFIVRPRNNSLQNRYLPMDLIRTDAILNLDDDVRISNSDYTTGFRMWQDNPNKLLGFIHRHISQNNDGKFHYLGDRTCQYNLILGAVIFFHRFYLYQYTYIQPHEIRAKVEELFNCEDIFINAMIADLTMSPGILMRLSPNSHTPQCLSSKCTQGRAISNGAGHYQKREICSNLIEHFYGYQTLLTSKTVLDQMKRIGC